MDQKEIDALEPKYTGNERDLTEGEAAAIKADPNFKKDERQEDFDKIPNAAALSIGLNINSRT
ncbi:hypothetical protein D3C73_903390 [compost metagenome]